ncbi:hypothetical protein SLA2020_490470 [Shorea laevis]
MMEAQVKALSKEIKSTFIRYRHKLLLDKGVIIQLYKAVLTESYYLSSIKWAVFRKRSRIRYQFRLKVPVPGYPNYIIGLNFEQDEEFLLLALGNFLKNLFLEQSVYSDYSLAYTRADEASALKTYVRIIRGFGRVKCLLFFDFSASMLRISVNRLLTKLKPFLHPYIYNLTQSYLELPVINERTGADIRWDMKVENGLEGFPPVGSEAANVLFNFYLDELDKSVQKAFPGLEYVRYKSGVVIPIYSESDICNSEFDLDQFTNLYEELNLACSTRTVCAGGKAVEFVGGLLFVDLLGYVNVIEVTESEP